MIKRIKITASYIMEYDDALSPTTVRRLIEESRTEMTNAFDEVYRDFQSPDVPEPYSLDASVDLAVEFK